jgi:hypothetical protein
MDIMLNGWLLYQTLACRMWARSGFYQASGAYGFRDQLQDCLALCVAAPGLAREHILRAAGRQFVEGDFQHWWLPATGQGVRTHIADDTVWLPYAVAHYIATTDDSGILDEKLAYLQGPTLGDHEHDAFFEPETSEKRASLYQHCVDAIERSLATGAHGLPLMGTGDWNDGMNRVGREGKGESVWLAWFLCRTLTEFAGVADAQGGAKEAEKWRAHAKAVASAIEHDAWDGDWYPPRVLRRRNAAWFRFQRGVPDRFNRPIVGGDFQSGLARARRNRDDGSQPAARRPRRSTCAAVHTAVRQGAAGAGLHQGIPRRASRERRAIHARRNLDDYRRSHAGARRQSC